MRLRNKSSVFFLVYKYFIYIVDILYIMRRPSQTYEAIQWCIQSSNPHWVRVGTTAETLSF